MKQLFKLFLISLMFIQPTFAGWDPTAEDKAKQTIEDFKSKDPKLMVFFEKAYGYAVFPTVGKGGIGIGGAYGKGTVFVNDSPIGSSTLSQFTIGVQLGGQSYSQIIFFKEEETFERFKQGNFEFDAQASAVAVDEGAAAHAAYEKGVAIFTMAKGGLMFEASVGGQKFTFEPKK